MLSVCTHRRACRGVLGTSVLCTKERKLRAPWLTAPVVLTPTCVPASIIGTPFYLMEYCPGIIYKDPSLPGLEPSRREAIYTAMNQVLCRIHSVDLQATGLDGFGKQGANLDQAVPSSGNQQHPGHGEAYPVAATAPSPATEDHGGAR